MIEDPAAPTWRALIAVNTCDRELYVRRCLPLLAAATADDPRFSVLVSLDGDDSGTRGFCEQWQVPLIYSDTREGVGISKNRVLERYPDFDYYFFLEDDVEVIDGSVFAGHVGLSHALGLHHMSLFERGGVRREVAETALLDQRIVHCLYGAADLNFFTRYGLERVGGWHPEFAKYRRWGHTEHSYRFVRAGLVPAPFNVAVTLSDACIWHTPPSVTQIRDIALDDDQISVPERALMNQKLSYVPIQTLSAHHVNDVPLGPLTRLAEAMDGGRQYPLLVGSEHRQARSDFLLWRFQTDRRPVHRLAAIVGAGLLWPRSPALRHQIKTLLRR